LLPGLFLVGLAVEALRLVVGLRAIAICRLRGRLILDADLLRLVDELRTQLDCRRVVELRVSSDIGTAATVGWLRPVILLADDWSAWPEDERRAVLAHELAHVGRRDYLLGLVAAACRAAHFYHPLVRWLTGRLRLYQELAADALAAEAAGGRVTYLRALARMALRQDECWAAGMARPLLSDRRTLLRRIAMLRVTEDVRPLSRAVRWGMAGMLVLTALGASAVRGPAQTPTEVPVPNGASAADLPPPDLSYVPPSAAGLAAIRPAALLTRPEMKPVVERWQNLWRTTAREAGFGPAFDIPFDGIEQVVVPIELEVYTEEQARKMPNGERHAVIMGLAMIRMTRDHDWPAALRALAPVVSVTEVRPGTFECRTDNTGPIPWTVHVLDRRTLVCSLFPGGTVNRNAAGAARWGAAWKQVEQAGLAIVYDNRDGRWTEALTRSPEFAPFATALGRPAHVAFGLHWGERIGVTCAADYAEEPSDADVTKGSESIRRILEGRLGSPGPEDAIGKVMLPLVSELLKNARVRRDGKLVTAESQSAVRWVDVLQVFTPQD
jgi:beta-lactamase regulating signal transducer with metallopeptidase domain